MTVSRRSAATSTLSRVARVHAIDTGHLTANKTFLRGEGFSSLLRRVEMFEFPVFAYVIEHDEGLVVVDTGLAASPPRPRSLRGFPPSPTRAGKGIAAGMRERGLDPADVRIVLLTHLDWDHTGGLEHFGGAEVFVHRPDLELARTRAGRFRFHPSLWPPDVDLKPYDLDPEPYGPFPASRSITEAGDVRVLPVPGHSPGQVAVAYDVDGLTLLFSADHALRADWLTEDLAQDRLLMLGAFGKKDARVTSRRLQELLLSRPTVLLPAHDADAPGRLARRETTTV